MVLLDSRTEVRYEVGGLIAKLAHCHYKQNNMEIYHHLAHGH